MPNNPILSILIPSRNYARFLPEAIESVLSQDFKDYEIVLSDDASEDESPQVLRYYSSVDPRIQATLHAKPLGMVGNWNWCLSRARGKYIKFVFGDDRLGPRNALSRQIASLEAHPSASIATSARTLIDERSRCIGLWDDLESDGVHRGLDVGKQCLLQTKNLIGEPTAVMMRTRCVKKAFDARYRQIVDLDFWLSLLSEGDLVYSKQALCEFRRHEKQATQVNSKLDLAFKEYAMLLRDHMQRFIPAEVALDLRERRCLFATLHYAQKAVRESEDARVVAMNLASRLRRTEYALHWVRYKILRPYVNSRLSLHKRLSKQKLEWSYSEGWKLHPGRSVRSEHLTRSTQVMGMSGKLIGRSF